MRKRTQRSDTLVIKTTKDLSYSEALLKLKQGFDPAKSNIEIRVIIKRASRDEWYSQYVRSKEQIMQRGPYVTGVIRNTRP